MNLVRLIALVVAVLALLAPAAHVLEMPNKLRLDGPLWLSVQQTLYRGWAPYIDGPTEIGGFVLALACFVISRVRRARALWLAGSACYAVMLIAFFMFDAPIDAVLSGWNAASLPADWESYRAKWETGHAISAVFAAGALIFVFSALQVDEAGAKGV